MPDGLIGIPQETILVTIFEEESEVDVLLFFIQYECGHELHWNWSQSKGSHKWR